VISADGASDTNMRKPTTRISPSESPRCSRVRRRAPRWPALDAAARGSNGR
jgi:hypothetical protein